MHYFLWIHIRLFTRDVALFSFYLPASWINNMCPCYHQPQDKFVLLQRCFAGKDSCYLQHAFVPVYKHFQTKLYNESEKQRNEWAHLSGNDDTSGDVCRARPLALLICGTLVDRVYAENIAQTTNLKVRACHRVAGLTHKYWISIFSQFCLILYPSLLNVSPVFCHSDMASPGLTFVVGDIIQERCVSYHIYIWVCRRMWILDYILLKLFTLKHFHFFYMFR